MNWSFTSLWKDKKGFTLLEFLIAFFILALVVSTVYGAYRGSLTLMAEIDEGREIHQQAEQTFMRISQDLSALSPYLSRFKFVTNPSAVGLDFLDLTFSSRAHLAFGEDEIPGGLAEVTYLVEEGEEKDVYRLRRKDVLYQETKEAKASSRGYVLCENIQSLSYRFIDNKGEEHLKWNSEEGSIMEKGRVPLFVMIELKLVNKKDYGRPYVFTTRLYLPQAKTPVFP